jgi:protein-tyrosine phosphatase
MSGSDARAGPVSARRQWHGLVSRWYGPRQANAGLSWLGTERIAISGEPTGKLAARLTGLGVTHLVNCRTSWQVLISQDLAAERELLGRDRVSHAPMSDRGQPQDPRLWAHAARFAASALDDDPAARVLIHCQQGRRRSAMVAYAVLRLRGHREQEATALILRHRVTAEIVPAYVSSVERWLAS